MSHIVRPRTNSPTCWVNPSTKPYKFSHDEDAITPAGPVTFISPSKIAPESRCLGRPGSAAGSIDSQSSSSTVTSTSSSMSFSPAVETADLWRRMLAVQRIYHCYNSARISAALDNEVLQKRIPSRACLDLLNDGISQLPEHEKQQVIYFIEHGKAIQTRKPRRFWKIRLLRTA